MDRVAHLLPPVDAGFFVIAVYSAALGNTESGFQKLIIQ